MGAPEDRPAFTPPPAFSITVAQAPGDSLLLVLEGEVDLATSGEFRRHVDSALEDGARTVVVDLAAVTFVDSTMLRELLRAHNDLQDRERRLVLVGAQSSVLRLLELTGTLDVFERASTREDALGGAG